MAAPEISAVGDRVAIGPLRTDLLELFHRWFNDEEAQHFGGFPDPPGAYAVEDVAAWLEEAARPDPERVWFVVYDTDGLRPIGYANVRDIDPRHRTAEWGLTIGAADRGRGFGTAATRLLVRYAFDVLGVRNLWMDVFAYNEAALRAYAKAGFREIGRRRGAHHARGQVWDVVLLDITPEDVGG